MESLSNCHGTEYELAEQDDPHRPCVNGPNPSAPGALEVLPGLLLRNARSVKYRGVTVELSSGTPTADSRAVCSNEMLGDDRYLTRVAQYQANSNATYNDTNKTTRTSQTPTPE